MKSKSPRSLCSRPPFSKGARSIASAAPIPFPKGARSIASAALSRTKILPPLKKGVAERERGGGICPPPPNTTQGFSLIEVLVALFILSIGILGLASLQLTALRTTQTVYYHSIANVQLAAMAERLRVNQSGSARNVECQRWNLVNQRLLPQSQGTCSCQSAECELVLHWQDSSRHTQHLLVTL